MWIPVLRAKIHRATVTDANLDYEGSISIGSNLLEASGLQPFQKVEIYNVTNGERFATYVMEGAPQTVVINGAAAWRARRNDIVIIASYGLVEDTPAVTPASGVISPGRIAKVEPRLVYVDSENRVVAVRSQAPTDPRFGL